MPAIVIKDYTWRQTSDNIIVHVPFKIRPKKVDLLAIDDYMKASFSPFILELFLWANIIEEESSCVVCENEIIFSMRKANLDVEWPKLALDDLDNETKRQYRNRALERSQLIAKEREKAKSEKRQHLQREAVKVQIDLDTSVLNKISAMKDAHRKEAMQELEDWKSKAELPILTDVQGEIQKNRKAYKPPLKWFKDDTGEIKSRPMTNQEIFRDDPSQIPQIKNSTTNKSIEEEEQERDKSKPKGNQTMQMNSQVGRQTNKDTLEKSDKESNSSTDTEPDSDCESCDERAKKNGAFKLCSRKSRRSGQDLIDRILKNKPRRLNNIFDEPSKAVPLPRKSGTINITFSERAFPTPARESYYVEEQEWLKKQAEARRKTGFVAEDLRPEEQDPQWLKDKGDEFFKAGNYLGAISAYSHGIKISDKMASLYVNRSAAHYALENYYRCVDDCSKALELMEPKCEANRSSRASCHARRGAALCKLSAPQHGIPELEEALKLAPENESIKRDLLAAKQYFNIKN